jgi:hypothetical protein
VIRTFNLQVPLDAKPINSDCGNYSKYSDCGNVALSAGICNMTSFLYKYAKLSPKVKIKTSIWSIIIIG